MLPNQGIEEGRIRVSECHCHSLKNVKMLIRRIDSDFGSDFIVTMAPVASLLQSDEPDPFSGFS